MNLTPPTPLANRRITTDSALQAFVTYFLHPIALHPPCGRAIGSDMLFTKLPPMGELQDRLRAKRAAMAYFLVSFQLKHSSELARRRFCDEIERLGGMEAIDAVYLIELDGTAPEVHQHLRKFLAANDSLIVAEFATAPEVSFPLAGTMAWVQERFWT